MSNDTPMNPAEYFDNVDAATVDLLASTAPIIQYVNGDVRETAGSIAHHGGWFFPEDQAPGEMADPFTPHTLVTAAGKEISGYAVRDLTLAILYARSAWLASTDAGLQRFPRNAYEAAKERNGGKNPRGHTQLLAVLRGFEDLGEFIATVKGMGSKA